MGRLTSKCWVLVTMDTLSQQRPKQQQVQSLRGMMYSCSQTLIIRFFLSQEMEDVEWLLTPHAKKIISHQSLISDITNTRMMFALPL